MGLNFSISSLLAGFVFGVWGVYFIKEGKRRALPAWAVLGLVLIVFPYFVDSAALTWIIGCVLVFLVTRFYR